MGWRGGGGGKGDAPVYFVVFEEGDGAEAVVCLESGRHPVVGGDALEVVGGGGGRVDGR